MERWKELDLYRKILLVVLIAGMLFGLIGYGVASQQEGILYQDVFFRLDFVEKDGWLCRRYTGRLDGVEQSFLVTQDKRVIHTIGDKETIYTIRLLYQYEPPKEGNFSFDKGFEVWRGETLLLRGGYDESGSTLTIEREDGELILFASNLWNGSKTEHMAAQMLRLVLAPGEIHRGNGACMLYCLLCGGLGVASILFADELFYFRLLFSIRDAEYAEPSEWELVSRCIGQTVFTGLCLICAFCAVWLTA